MYTIISYRENDAVYRGGYCDGRTNSDFNMETTESREEAVKRLGHYIYVDLRDRDWALSKDCEFTASAEILLGINGYFGCDYSLEGIVGSNIHEQYRIESEEMRKEAVALGRDKYEAHLVSYREIQRQAADAAKFNLAAIKEAEEREQLARLKEKYGE